MFARQGMLPFMLITTALAGVVVAVGGFWPNGVGAGAAAAAGAVVVTCALACLHLTQRDYQSATQLADYIQSLGDNDDTTPELPRSLAPAAQAAHELARSLRAESGSAAESKRSVRMQSRLIEAQREQVDALIEAVSDAVIVTNASNRVAATNDAAARLLGFDARSAIHRPVDDVIQDPDLVQLIDEARRDTKPVRHSHLHTVTDPGGPRQPVDITLARVRNTDDEPHPAQGDEPATAPGVITVLRDASGDEQLADMRVDFVSSVSHELRTPLASITGYLEMLIDGEARDDVTRLRFYNVILTQTNRLSRLVENILNMGRIEANVLRVQRERVALADILKDAIDVVRPQARAQQIELVESDPGAATEVYADRDMLFQAVLNLLTNAVKYTTAGGRVTTTITPDDGADTIELAVTDTGVGVPAVDLPRIFDKFYRVSTHKKLADGAGLGLSLVKHVVETLHGGKVSAESEPGKGSRFAMQLPMTPDPPAAQTGSQPQQLATNHRGVSS